MSDIDRKSEQSARALVPESGRTDRTSQRISRRVRWGVLGAVLVAITALGIAHQRGVQVVGVDALCPFGGIETLFTLATTASLIQRVAASSVILLVGVALTAALFRRTFCGYVCPLGALQEFVGMIGQRLFGRNRPTVPAVIDRLARYLKYVVLAAFVAWSWEAASLVLRPYDPWVAYMHLTSGELFTQFAVGAAVLGVSLVGSVVYERFFCKYLCPMGAFLGVMSPLSVFKVRRDETVCIDCKSCDAVCPVNVKVSTVDVVSDPECINCNECVNVCPAKGALEVTAPGTAKSRRSLRPNAILAGTAVILALVVAGTTASGAFTWTLPGLAKPAEAGAKVDVEQIRGSMTFAEVSEATGIAPAAIQQRFGCQEADMHVPMKTLAEAHGFDIETDVREWVRERSSAK